MSGRLHEVLEPGVASDTTCQTYSRVEVDPLIEIQQGEATPRVVEREAFGLRCWRSVSRVLGRRLTYCAPREPVCAVALSTGKIARASNRGGVP